MRNYCGCMENIGYRPTKNLFVKTASSKTNTAVLLVRVQFINLRFHPKNMRVIKGFLGMTKILSATSTPPIFIW